MQRFGSTHGPGGLLSHDDSNTQPTPSNPLEWAEFWVAAGVPVFPVWNANPGGVCCCPAGVACKSPGKHPRTPSGVHDATLDTAQVRQWWAAYPDANVGGACGNGLFVVDIDGPAGRKSAALLGGAVLPPTLECHTGKGVHKYYVYDPDDGMVRNTQNWLGENIDTRGDGGYVLLPGSTHPNGSRYTLVGELDSVAAMPAELWAAMARPETAPPSNTAANAPVPANERPTNNALFKKHLTAFLNRLRAAETGRRHVTLRGGVRDLAGYWHLQDGMADTELWAAIRKAVVAAYGDDRELRTAHSAWSHGLQQPHVQFPETITKGGMPTAGVAAHRYFFGRGVEFGPNSDVYDMLEHNRYGRPKKSKTNIVNILLHDPRWRELGVWVNGCSELPMLGPVELEDAHVHQLVLWLHAAYDMPECAPAYAGEAVVAAAQHRHKNPLQDYLRGLVWDGVPRLHELPRRFAASTSPMAGVFLRKTLVAMIARALNPGCKADTVLVLQGAQGTRKSTACEILGGDWYKVGTTDLGGKDSKVALRGTWVIEWAELASAYKSRVERLKEFITTRADSFRPVYGKSDRTYPRTNVFIGTTNDSEFLKDQTGQRRFWVVAVGGDIDTDWLEANRDQLFAEAVVAYRDGEQWHLTQEEEAAQVSVAAQYVQAPDWAEDLEDWLEGSGPNPPKWTGGWKIGEFLSYIDTLNRRFRVTPREVGAYLRHTLGFRKCQHRKWWAATGVALERAQRVDPEYNERNRAFR